MKSILFVVSNLGQGGSERQSITVARQLKKKGYSVSFICWMDRRFLEPLLVEEGIPIYWDVMHTSEKLKESKLIPSFIRKVICSLLVIQYIMKNHGDVTISFLNQANVFCLVAKKLSLKKWKVITTLRSMPLFETGGYTQTAKLLKGAYAIVSNSENAKNDWLYYYPHHKDKFSVIHNMVSLGEVTNSYIPLLNNKTHIIIAAGYRPEKNINRLLEAVESLSQDTRSKLEINWYGQLNKDNGVYNQAIGYIKRHELTDCIRLHDSSKNIASLMKQADFVALFSEHEGFPNAICEGMMVGKPIIMSKVSDYNRLVSEKNGYLCNAFDSASIANAIEKAISNNSEELQKMGNESRRIARELFSEEAVINQWISLIES